MTTKIFNPIVIAKADYSFCKFKLFCCIYCAITFKPVDGPKKYLLVLSKA